MTLREMPLMEAENKPPDAGPSGEHNSRTPQDALREAFTRLGEVREYSAYLVQARIDALKATGRNILLYAVAGVLGLVMGVAFVGTAAVLLLLGIAHGLGEWFHHAWIGEVVVSGVVLLVIAGGILFGLKWLPRIMRKQMVSKYEARQRKQRSDFGHDVAQQARAARDHAATLRN